MKLLYLTLSLVLSIGFCYAQQDPASQKPHNTYFFKKNGAIVRSIDSADYIRLVFEPDSGSKLYNVEEYYLNNQPRFIGKSSDMRMLWAEGQGMSYYPTGQKKQFANYKDNSIYGTVCQYYPNGKIHLIEEYIYPGKRSEYGKIIIEKDCLIKAEFDSTGKVTVENGNGYYTQYDKDFKTIVEEGPVKDYRPEGHWKGKDPEYGVVSFEEDYDKGKLIKGQATDTMGNITSYKQRFTEGKLRNGSHGLWQYIFLNTQYPKQAYKNNIQGIVWVDYTVEKDGETSNVRAVSYLDETLEQEAVRVIENLHEWIPGTAYGSTAKSYYGISILFRKHP